MVKHFNSSRKDTDSYPIVRGAAPGPGNVLLKDVMKYPSIKYSSRRLLPGSANNGISYNSNTTLLHLSSIYECIQVELT